MSSVTLASIQNMRKELVKSRYYLNIRSGYMAPVTLHCSYGDSGESVTFYIFDGGDELDLTGSAVSVHGTRRDGANFGPFACTVDGNAATFELQSTMTAVEGGGIAEITITKGSTTIGTCNFGIMVEDAVFPNGVAYDSDPSVYQDILAYVQTIPASLTADYTSKIAAEVTARTNSIAEEATARIIGDNTNNTAIAVERARIDNYLNSGTAATDSELIDIRTKADGTVSASAGNAVREQVNVLKSNLYSMADTFVELNASFIRGGVASDGTVNTQTHRVVTQSVLHYSYPIYLKCIDSNYMFDVFVYNSSGTYTNNHYAGYIDNEAYIGANTYFRLLIYKKTETATPADIELFRSKVLMQSKYAFELEQKLVLYDSTILNTSLKKRLELKNYSSSQGKFIDGGYWSLAVPLQFPFDLTITNSATTSYQFNVKTWTADSAISANYVGTSGWLTTTYKVLKGTYFTVEVSRINSSIAVPTNTQIANSLTFSTNETLYEALTNAKECTIIETPGYFNTDGTYHEQSSNYYEQYTQKFPINTKSIYIIEMEYSAQQAMWGAYVLYDEYENTLTRETFSNVVAKKKIFSVTTTNANAKYVAFCYRAYQSHTIRILCDTIENIDTQGFALNDAKLRLQDYAVNPNVNSINHRGYNHEAPENTLPAYRLSRQHGFKMAECDISFTSDGVAVLLHDSTINRTARNMDGSELSDTVLISSITYSQAASYDFGIWKGSQWAGTPIPTFEEFITLCRNIGLHPYVEIKEAGLSQANVNTIVDIARNCGMAKNVTWISFSVDALQYVVQRNPKARVGLLANTVTSSIITSAQNLQNDTNDVFINSGSYTTEEVTLCQNANIPMEVWNFASVSAITALPAYVSGITTDNYVASYVLYQSNISNS